MEITEEYLRGQNILDVDSGLAYCADMFDIYLETIEGYVFEDNRHDKINNLYKEEDWHNYQIEVHALKSSSYLIGANELGDKAKALEEACKNGDYAYINDNHSMCMKEYKEILDNLGLILNKE